MHSASFDEYDTCRTYTFTIVSWGTKGDNKASDLGGVKIVKDGKTEVVDVELPFQDLKDKTALNEDYNRWLASLPNRPAFVEPKRDAKTKMEDW